MSVTDQGSGSQFLRDAVAPRIGVCTFNAVLSTLLAAPGMESRVGFGEWVAMYWTGKAACFGLGVREKAAGHPVLGTFPRPCS